MGSHAHVHAETAAGPTPLEARRWPLLSPAWRLWPVSAFMQHSSSHGICPRGLLWGYTKKPRGGSLGGDMSQVLSARCPAFLLRGPQVAI